MLREQALERIKKAVGLYLPSNSKKYMLKRIREVLAEIEQDAYARGYRDGLHDAEQGNAGEF